MPLDGGGELDLATRVNLVLAEAADLIERNGWCQKVYRIDERLCAREAIRQAVVRHYGDEAQRWTDVIEPAVARMKLYIGNYSEVTDWNDAQPADTGEAIVLRTLRRASGLAA